jgi:hypothetical protein
VGKMKQSALGACLFTFLFVIIGGGLHLNPVGAFLPALSGTPLLIHVFSRWLHSQAGGLDLLARNDTRPLARAPSRREEESHLLRGPNDEAESVAGPGISESLGPVRG